MHRTLLFDRQFWRFYGRLVRQMPSILWTAADRYLTVVGVVSFFVFLLNPEIVALAESAWAGVSRWWALVPLGILFAYGLMKANYEAFQEVEQEREQERQEKEALEKKVTTDERRAALKDELGTLHQEAKALQEGNASYADAEEWGKRVYTLITAAVGPGEAQRFASDAGMLPFNYPNRAMEYIESRLQRINELIERVDTLILRSDFDG